MPPFKRQHQHLAVAFRTCCYRSCAAKVGLTLILLRKRPARTCIQEKVLAWRAHSRSFSASNVVNPKPLLRPDLCFCIHSKKILYALL